MCSTFQREIPEKTFKERIQWPSIISFFALLFLNLIGLNVPGLNLVYLIFFTCCIVLVWIIHVFLAQKKWFNKIEINENGIYLHGFDLNRPIVRYIPFENYTITIESHNKRRQINPDYYQFRLKSSNQFYILNANREWNDQLMFEILKELSKWHEVKSFLIDGIHYLSDFQQRAKNTHL